jgi:hypothetical protein
MISQSVRFRLSTKFLSTKFHMASIGVYSQGMMRCVVILLLASALLPTPGRSSCLAVQNPNNVLSRTSIAAPTLRATLLPDTKVVPVFGIRISNPGDAAFALGLGEAFGNGQNLSLDSISFDMEDSRHSCTHWSLIQGGIISGRIAPAVMIFPSHSSLFFRLYSVLR